jgi:hypothetical protein
MEEEAYDSNVGMDEAAGYLNEHVSFYMSYTF